MQPRLETLYYSFVQTGSSNGANLPESLKVGTVALAIFFIGIASPCLAPANANVSSEIRACFTGRQARPQATCVTAGINHVSFAVCLFLIQRSLHVAHCFPLLHRTLHACVTVLTCVCGTLWPLLKPFKINIAIRLRALCCYSCNSMCVCVFVNGLGVQVSGYLGVWVLECLGVWVSVSMCLCLCLCLPLSVRACVPCAQSLAQ